jgi:hypothetical protein
MGSLKKFRVALEQLVASSENRSISASGENCDKLSRAFSLISIASDEMLGPGAFLSRSQEVRNVQIAFLRDIAELILESSPYAEEVLGRLI